MATIKMCTDIPQSKVLAKILPHNSADMGWYYSRNPQAAKNQMWVGTKAENADIPCWSLAALLSVLPQSVRLVGTPKDSYWYCECVNSNNQWYAGFGSAENPVDACVAMIEKLNEMKMI